MPGIRNAEKRTYQDNHELHHAPMLMYPENAFQPSMQCFHILTQKSQCLAAFTGFLSSLKAT